MRNKSKAYTITIRAVLTALIILQTMVPFLGFIPLGITSLTIIHVTVIVAAIVLGPADGMFVGLMWGIFTVIRAFTSPTSPLDTLVFTNPIVSVVPRVLVGLFAGLVFIFLYRKTKSVVASSVVAAVVGTLTNTVLVLVFMALLYTTPVANAYGVETSGLAAALLAVIATNGVTEIITAVVITPIIVKALFAATHLSPGGARLAK